MTKEITKSYPWYVMVCMCCLSGASAGFVFNLTSLFYTPVSKDLNLLTGDFSFHYTIMMITLAIFSLIIPNIVYRYGFKKPLIIGVLLSSVSTILMGFTSHLLLFYLLGFIKGIGTSFFANVPLTMVINNWFTQRNGLALSLTFASGGLVGLIFSPILSIIITNYGWQVGFISKGVFIFLFCLPAILFPFNSNPKDQGLSPYGEAKGPLESRPLKADFPQRKESVYLSPAFFFVFLFALLQSSLLGITGQMPGIGQNFGFSVQVASYMMSIVMVGSLIYKLLMGQLSDKIGINKATLLMIISNILGAILLLTSKQSILFIIGTYLFSSIYGVVAISYAVLSRKYFGRVQANRVFPLISMASNLGKALAVSGVGYIFDYTNSYDLAFILALLGQLVCMSLLYLGNRYTNNQTQSFH